MRRALRILKKSPAAQASVITVGSSALAHSAEAADFGFVSLNNAQGASEAIAELSQYLDESLNDFEFDGVLSGGRQLLESRLNEESRKYSNTNLGQSSHSRTWSCFPSEAQIISLAMRCAAMIYDGQSPPDANGLTLRQLQYIPHSGFGTVKAAALTLAQDVSLKQPANPLLPALVIAIKGSKTVVDWMVNLNSQTCDATELFNSTALGGTEKISVHAGFLNGAKALLPILTKHLKAALGQGSIRHVVLTGHSSGGAVASLIFARLLSIAAAEYPSIKFSLITFGAPPVATPDLTPILKAQPAKLRGMVLAFVNEHDPVPRSDTDYIRSLVDLYRSRFNLKPMADNEKIASPQGPAITIIPNHSAQQQESKDDKVPPVWPLSAPLLAVAGDIVVLKDSNPNGEEVRLSALLVNPREFSGLLFVRSAVHSRTIYLDNINRIKGGNFDDKEGWQS